MVVYICLAPLLISCGRAQELGPNVGSKSREPVPAATNFRSESRQVLLEATVWSRGVEKRATSPLSTADQPMPKGWPTPARGLTVKDFRVLDSGVEQKINFLKELNFDVGWPPPWVMESNIGGTWGMYEPGTGVYATATYLLGFIPSQLKPGECRSVAVVVEGHEVDVNRTKYCNPEAGGRISKPEVTAALTQMEVFAKSNNRSPINLSIQAFSFWSSGVLRVLTDVPLQADDSVEPGADYTYFVRVHDDKAPATIHIAAEFQWRSKDWDTAECFKKNPSVHILGTVYKSSGTVETQFDDTFPCLMPNATQTTPWKYGVRHNSFAHMVRIPTRFDTQVELHPGDYSLRVIVTDGISFGQTQIPLHVPNFDSGGFGISDLVLGGIVRDASWVPRDAASVYPEPIIPTPLVSKDVQFFPAIDLIVSKHEPLSLYFEIYEPLLETQATIVSFSVRIADLKTNSLVMNTGPVSASNWILPGNAVIPIGLKLNVEKLKTGSYRLEIQGADSIGRKTDWRQVAFRVD